MSDESKFASMGKNNTVRTTQGLTREIFPPQKKFLQVVEPSLQDSFCVIQGWLSGLTEK